MNNQPPKIPLCFLRWFCDPRLLKYIEGDLLELFEERVSNKGYRKAKWFLFWEVVKLFRPGIIKSFSSTYRLNQYGMLKNYFKVSWRNMFRQKLYSTINILGLSIGVLCFVMLFVYIQYEQSFDLFYQESDHIYRVYQQQENNEFMGSNFFAITPAQLAKVLAKDFPEVRSATSFKSAEIYLGREGVGLYLQKGVLASESFFEVFERSFILGNPVEFARNPTGIVITATLRDKLFGTLNPIGERLSVWGRPCKIVGVIDDFPSNSTLEVSFIANLKMLERYVRELEQESWKSSSYHTFFKVNPGTDDKWLEAKLQEIANEHRHDFRHGPVHYFVQPLSDLHLSAGVNWDPGVHGNIQQIQLFSIVAFLILILACTNYVNLAMARSIRRAKEVGLRKVIGAARLQLIIQFLTESVLFSFVALLLAIGMLFFLLPLFGQYVDRPLKLALILQSDILWIVPGTLLMVSLMSGFYPAVYVSALQPIKAIRRKETRRFGKISFPKVLTGFQYAISSGMFICCIVIFQQFQFIQTKDPGINRENVVTVKLNGDDYEHITAIKDKWSQLSGVKEISASASLPIDVGGNNILTDENGVEHLVYRLGMDAQSKDVFGIELVAGRYLSGKYAQDRTESVLLNERAVAEFGWSAEEAIGKKITSGQEMRVVGVVKDFHMQSMHLSVAPLFIHWADQYSYLSVLIDGTNLSETVHSLHDEMSQYSAFSLEFEFLDNLFFAMYSSEMNEGKIFGLFTAVAMFIAGIGLFGMAALSAERRTKEIGIRRVLGAPMQTIIGLLNREFLGLVIVGSLISIPFAWMYLSDWLMDYAYHISISWWVILVPCFVAILIAGLTVSFQSYKMIKANPVDSLHDE